jgi:hypothetical protein
MLASFLNPSTRLDCAFANSLIKLGQSTPQDYNMTADQADLLVSVIDKIDAVAFDGHAFQVSPYALLLMKPTMMLRTLSVYSAVLSSRSMTSRMIL